MVNKQETMEKKEMKCRDCDTIVEGYSINRTLCIPCKDASRKKITKKYRESHKEQEKAYKKEHRQIPEVKEETRIYQRKYNKDNRGIRREIEIRYKIKYPEKKLAHQKARFLPMKSECEHCRGTDDLQKHHPDYSKPTYVITLCQPCHTKHHLEDDK